MSIPEKHAGFFWYAEEEGGQMDQSLHDEISRIFAQIDTEQAEMQRGTQESNTTGRNQTDRPRRIITVYIDVLEEESQEREEIPEEASIVESTSRPVITRDEPTATPKQANVTEEVRLTYKATFRQRYVRLVPVLFIPFCLIVLGAFTAFSVLPLITPSATVTIIPVSQFITTTSVIHLVTGPVDPTAHQLKGHIVSAESMKQTQTVPTTGRVHQDARAGTGFITFYNAAPYMQTVSAGTLMTGTSGVQVVTEQDAIVPAVSYPTLGQATVLAHTTMTGPEANMRAGDIYGPCCRLNISAVSSTFHGGQATRSYQTVSQQDTNGVVSHLKANLEKKVRVLLQAQLHADETLVSPFPCKSRTTADHQVGDEAQQLRVTMSETCIGEAYNTHAYHDVALQIMREAAVMQLGKGYTLIGDIQATTDTTTTNKQGAIDLKTILAGTWTYQFTKDRVDSIKAMIAGKSEVQAKAIVLTSPGVQTASMALRNSTTLPTDTSNIHAVVLVVGT